MKIDIDTIAAQAIEQLAPWDLVLTIGGKDYPTVRPKPGLVAMIESGKADMEQIFAGWKPTPPGGKPPKQTNIPDLRKLDSLAIAAITAAYLLAVRTEVEKNSPALVETIRNQISPRATTGGTTSQP